MKRSIYVTAFLGLMVLGFAQWRLVARAEADSDTEAVAGVSEQPAGAAAESAAATSPATRVDEFVEKIQAGTDDLLAQFQKTLRSPAGKIVLRDRATQSEANLRAQAEAGALPAYLAAHFVRDDEGKYRLQEGQAGFREELLALDRSYREDVAQITPVLRELAEQMSAEDDIDRLLGRFLRHETAPVVWYVAELRPRLRPGPQQVAERLAEVFARDGLGHYLVPDSQRDRAQELLGYAQRRIRGAALLQQELQEWSEEFAERDDLHRQMKAATAEPLFAASVALDSLGDDQSPLEDALDGYFNHLEDITHDTAEGLVFTDESREEAEQMLANYTRLQETSERLQEPLANFVSHVPAHDSLHRGWREVLGNPVGVAGLARDLTLADADPAKACRAMLEEALEPAADGKSRVKADYREQISNQLQDYFRRHREVRRKGKALDEFARQLADAELASLYASWVGKFAASQSIQEAIEGRAFDGFAAWRDAHFEPSGDGYLLKDGAEQEIQSIVDQAAEVNKEAGNHDF